MVKKWLKNGKLLKSFVIQKIKTSIRKRQIEKLNLLPKKLKINSRFETSWKLIFKQNCKKIINCFY